MANTIRIKRRAAGGAAGAPPTLQNAELAYNEADDVLYYGKGSGGANGTATQAVPIAGPGFLGAQAGTVAPTMNGAASAGVSAKLAREDHVHPSDTSRAPLASPAFTGTPTVPTAAPGTNTTQAANTAFVQAAVAALVASSPAALDTLNELAAALGNDANFAATMSTNLGLKMAKSANLSDLVNIATARANLGLGTLALQNAAAIAITGGTIDGINFDGGTF